MLSKRYESTEVDRRTISYASWFMRYLTTQLFFTYPRLLSNKRNVQIQWVDSWELNHELFMFHHERFYECSAKYQYNEMLKP